MQAQERTLEGKEFYGIYDAQFLFKEHEEEIGIKMVDFKNLVYVQERAQYEEEDTIKDRKTLQLCSSRAQSLGDV